LGAIPLSTSNTNYYQNSQNTAAATSSNVGSTQQFSTVGDGLGGSNTNVASNNFDNEASSLAQNGNTVQYNDAQTAGLLGATGATNYAANNYNNLAASTSNTGNQMAYQQTVLPTFFPGLGLGFPVGF